MTHRQHMNRDEQTAAVLSARTIACPNCDHGIDPHGIDPGGVCGVGDENRDRCPCVLSPNAVAWLLMAAAWDEGHETPWQRDPDDGCRCAAWSSHECGCGKYGTGRLLTPNPYRSEDPR